MKKFILSVIVIVTITIASSFCNITFNNPGGWWASSGTTWLPGELISWHMIPGGYGVLCDGLSGYCFAIDGPDLTLYTNLGQGIIAPNVDILKQ